MNSGLIDQIKFQSSGKFSFDNFIVLFHNKSWNILDLNCLSE